MDEDDSIKKVPIEEVIHHKVRLFLHYCFKKTEETIEYIDAKNNEELIKILHERIEQRRKK
jgi:hypothetical protein